MFDKRLFNALGKEKIYLVYSLLIKISSLFINICMIFTIANFIETVYMKNSYNYKTYLIFLGLIIFKFIISRLELWVSFKLSSDVKNKLRDMLLNKIYSLGISYSEKIDTSEIVQLSVEGIENLNSFYGNFIPQLIYSLITPIILFFVLSPIDLKMVSIILILVPIIPLAIVMVQKLAKKVTKKYWGSYTSLSEKFLDFLEGLTTLKIYGSDNRANEDLNNSAEEFRKQTMSVLAVQLNNITVMDIIGYLGAGLGSILAFWRFSEGEISISQAIIFILISAEFFLQLRLLGSFFHVAMNGMTSAERLFDILDIEKIEQGEEALISKDISVELDKVSFSYDGQRNILKDIDMKFPAKKLCAITGQSGCGKSTIASLIIGNLNSDIGKVLINGKDKISSKSRLKNCTLVNNSPYLFKGTVRYNLLMGNPNATEKEMWNILEKLDLKDNLELDNGLDSIVQENGNNFSGGQRQRLAIARALLKKSPLYIFDEATSNIDSESEEKIMNIINEIIKESTVILISHQLKHAKNASNIYHMSNGEILEEGKFDELLELNGDFNKLYSKQVFLETWGVE